MRLSIRHDTTYRYASPVLLSQQIAQPPVIRPVRPAEPLAHRRRQRIGIAVHPVHHAFELLLAQQQRGRS